MPIVVGIAALVLLGLLGWGIWLIVRSTGDEPQTPAPAPPTSAAPLTTEPTTPTVAKTTTPAEPAQVTIPALRGLSQSEAQRALDRRGLSYRSIKRASSAAAGTVIDSAPSEGQEVPADTQVVLVIATPQITTATPGATTATPSSAPATD